jgi:hypothetical protein
VHSTIAIGAGAALVVGWLAVSFQRPGRVRAILEWASALAMYLLLFVLMASQFERFLASGKWILVGTFAFLCFLFASGFVVTAVLLLREILGKKDAGTDATH